MSRDSSNIVHSPQTPLHCEMCSASNNIFWYCKNCEGDLCTECKEKHLVERPIFRKHQIIPREEASVKIKPEQCARHESNLYIMYCDTCTRFVCTTCLTNDHKGHDLIEIEDAMIKVQQVLDELSQKLESALLSQCNLQSKVTEDSLTHNKLFTSLQTEINKQRVDIKTKVDLVCDSLLEMAFAEKNRNSLTFNTASLKLEGNIREINNLKQRVEHVLTQRNSDKIKLAHEIPNVDQYEIPQIASLKCSSVFPSDKTVGNHIIEQVLKMMDPALSPLYSPTMASPLVSLTIPSSIANNVSSAGTKETMETRHVSVGSRPTSEHVETFHTAPNSTKDVPNLPYGDLIQEIDVEVISRQNHDISVDNIVPASNDETWISQLLTQQIKLVDLEGKTLKTIDTNFEIDHFVVPTYDEIIATDWWGECIKQVSHTGQVTATIPTSGYSPSGICLCNNRENIAVVMSRPTRQGGGSKLVVYDLDGQVILSTIYTEKSTYTTQRVTQNNTGDFCIVHRADDLIYVLDKTGAVKFTYAGHDDTQMEEKFTPQDVCCDKYNNILITDYKNQTIHMLDNHGNFLRYLISPQDRVGQVTGLGIDPVGKLWVGEHNTGSLCVVKYLKSTL